MALETAIQVRWSIILKYPKQIAVHFGILNTHRASDLLQPPLAFAELISKYALAPLYFISVFHFHNDLRADSNSGDEQSYPCPWKCSSTFVTACLTIKTKQNIRIQPFLHFTFYFCTHSLTLLGWKFSDRISDLCLFTELALFSSFTSLFKAA